jgi:hypothetical protein
MSADVISFPGDGLSDHQWTEAEVDKLHGDAFRDLEMGLRDCVRMSEITAEMILRAKLDDKGLCFAAIHLADMLMRLEKEYDARWHGERSEPC